MADPRQRSAKTKRMRTRHALLEAALPLFTERGWYGTRIEDIARAAGVSTATTYNHFRTKQSLLSCAYAQVLEELRDKAEKAIRDRHSPVTAITQYIRDLSGLSHSHRGLTVCLITAMQENSQKSGNTCTGADEVLGLNQVSGPLTQLIAYGQDTGTLRTGPSADDMGVCHTSALLLRVLSRPHETAEKTASATLNQLLPTLFSASPPPGQAPPEQTDSMQETLNNLAIQAEDTMTSVRGGMDDAMLTEIVDALESLTTIIGVLHQMASAVNQRAAQIRDREASQRRDGTALETMDSGLANLAHGQETASVLHHLLAMGRRDLDHVARDAEQSTP